jgi:hypothetical protein
MDALAILLTLIWGGIIGYVVGTLITHRVLERKTTTVKNQTIQNTVNVDWSVLLNALEGAGYTVVENQKIEKEVRH